MIPPVIILGLKNTNAIGVIRCLGEEGVPCIGINISPKKEFAYYSKYLIKKYFCKKGYSEKDLLKLLINMDENERGIIIPTSDEMVMFLHNYKGRLLKEKYIFNISEKLNDLMNKNTMKQMAREVGFETPRTFNLNMNVEQKGFPLLIKPNNVVGYGKDYYQVVRNKKELKAFLAKIEKIEDFICEEFVPGDANDMFEIIAYRDNQGGSQAPCVIKKIRQYPPIKGSSSFIKTVNNRNLSAMATKFLDLINYVGIADIEVKYNRENGCYYFIEINYRPGGPIYLSKASGVNVPFQYYSSMLGQKIDERYCQENITWMHDSSDWKNIGKDVTALNFLKNVIKTNSFAFFNSKDLKPFLYTGYYKLIRMLKNSLQC